MNKPKSTKIELTMAMYCDMAAVWRGHLERAAVPGKHKVWRKGGKIYLEVFHNEP